MRNRFIPDTPKEFAQIGMAISRLGTAMSAVLIFQASHLWVIGSLILTWLGSELAQYFKLEEQERVNQDTVNPDPPPPPKKP